MQCTPGEYHPYAACLMFRACGDSTVVRANLDAVRAQPTPPAVVEPLTYERIMAAWNAQADEHNQWDELGEDEKIEWAVKCAHGIKGDSHGLPT